jgi:phage-related baseplate assembly protein
MSVNLDLSRLPAPNIIEALDFETILTTLKKDLQRRYPDWSADLESEPLVKLLEVASYRELILRQRINDAARANLLAFAGDADLEHLASFYGVTRLFSETDTALRLRIQQRIQGVSNAGGAAHYRFWALTAAQNVKDAAVSSPIPGLVRIAILSREGEGAPSAELLAKVKEQVTRDDVRVLTDQVEVVSANIIKVDILAKIYLYPQTPKEVFEQIIRDFPQAFEAERGLGWDLTHSWIIARLHAPGVHSVILEAPQHDITAGPDDCTALGTVKIELAGRKQ